MLKTFIVLVFFISIGNGQNVYNNRSKRQMYFIGLAMEGFSPCPDDFIIMEREIGRRPSEENYWKGFVNLMKYKNIPEARIELQLDTPAILTIDPEIARIYSDGELFRIFPFNVQDRITFEVKAQQDKPFPNIVSMRLNGGLVCENPRKIKPTILGPTPQAIGTVTSSPMNFTSLCGRRQLIPNDMMMIHKSSTRYGDWPWHIALYFYNRQKTTLTFKCGGTLISTRAVVTSADCVMENGEKIPSDLLIVLAGKYLLRSRSIGSQEREVLEIYLHPEFNKTTLRNYIAIIRLFTEITFTEYVQPICLWPARNTAKTILFRRQGVVIGWGLDQNGTLSEYLKKEKQIITPDMECNNTNPDFYSKYIYDKSFCAKNIPGKGANGCKKNNGGGLVLQLRQPDNKRSYFLRGIVFVKNPKKTSRICQYTVYTDAAKYLDFINKYK